MAKDVKNVKARVLSAGYIGAVRYEGNELVSLDAGLAKDCAAVGLLDLSDDAVAYCENELKVVPRDHAAEVAAADKSAAGG